MVGLKNKDGESWKGLEKWDVIVMMETWVEKREWEGRRDKLPAGWSCQKAKRRSKWGRAMRTMVMGIRRELIWREEEEGKREEGILARKIKYRKGCIIVIGVYVNADVERKLEEMREWIEGREERVRMIFEGDFNARTGEEGGRMEEVNRMEIGDRIDSDHHPVVIWLEGGGKEKCV